MAPMKVCRSIDELQEAVREKVREEPEGSGRALARKVGISTSQMSYFKKGERNMTYRNLHVLAEHFGIRYCLKNY